MMPLRNGPIFVLLIGAGLFFVREMLHYATECWRDWRFDHPGRGEYLPPGWDSRQGDRLGKALAAQRKERQT